MLPQKILFGQPGDKTGNYSPIPEKDLLLARNNNGGFRISPKVHSRYKCKEI